ncbi:hypothetical protein Ndes2437A_g02448 [Nannochloris sp. 'desiccata']
MACPLRVVLAMVSAFIALFIIWKSNSENGNETKSNRLSEVGTNRTWLQYTMDFFTGKYLWNLIQASRQQQPPSRVEDRAKRRH